MSIDVSIFKRNVPRGMSRATIVLEVDSWGDAQTIGDAVVRARGVGRVEAAEFVRNPRYSFANREHEPAGKWKTEEWTP